MAMIVDTGFLFALANSADTHHVTALQHAQILNDTMILPITVLPEICYLLDSRLGHRAMRQFVQRLQLGALQIESLTMGDLERTTEILMQYADARIDFVDATICAIAERLHIERILTIDRRHFQMFRPKHCAAFELLP